LYKKGWFLRFFSLNNVFYEDLLLQSYDGALFFDISCAKIQTLE